MRGSRFWLGMVAGLASIVGGIFDARAFTPPSGSISSPPAAHAVADERAISARMASLPLRFEPNHGQFDEQVSFLARTPGLNLFLTPDGATLALSRKHDDKFAVSTVVMHVVGGQRVKPFPVEPVPGTSHYFIGNDRSKWRTNVEGYGCVRYPDVLPGVDVVYYGTGQRRLEYDVVLAPGTDPKCVAIAFEGADLREIDREGAAVLRLPDGGELAQPAPVAYQVDAAGNRERVSVRYERRGAALGFAVGRLDSRRALVIDPTLAYSTYLGGSGTDLAYGIAADSAGEAFVVGVTTSSNFPTASSLQGTSGYDAFVTKLNAAGSALVYSTYLGGGGGADAATAAQAVAVDSAGEALVAGWTSSTTFPTAPLPPPPAVGSLALQPATGGGRDAFVTKLSADGSALVYSTYLGGNGDDYANGIAVDAASEAFVVGYTYSTNFPTASAFQGSATYGGAQTNAFVTKLNVAGSALVYSTYLAGSTRASGSGGEVAQGVAVDASGEAFVVGSTGSTNFPTASPLQASLLGGTDAFVTKFNAAGSALIYSTYLGGTSSDGASAVAVDAAGEAFVVGSTNSTDFPLASPFQNNIGYCTAFECGGAFVTKLNAAGSAEVYSTYLNGSFSTGGADAIAVDAAGEAFVTGVLSSPNATVSSNPSPPSGFPTVSPVQATCAGTQCAFVTQFNAAGSALLFSSYLGGTSTLGNGIAVDSAGEAFVAGGTGAGFPTASPFQGTYGGGAYDVFVAKISATASTPVPAIGGKASLLGALLLLGGLLRLPRGRRKRAESDRVSA